MTAYLIWTSNIS